MTADPFDLEVRRVHRRVTRELGPKLNAELEKSHVNPSQRTTLFSVVIAQNVMKMVLQRVAHLSIPFTMEWVVEMAVRMAVYCLTLAPAADRPALMALVLKGIPEKMAQYDAQGFKVADTDWEDGK